MSNGKILSNSKIDPTKTAPISAFDQVSHLSFYFFHIDSHTILITQYLEEDPKTNRIDDSLQLFTSICSNKLLKDAHLVLLLNKVCSFWASFSLSHTHTHVNPLDRRFEAKIGRRNSNSKIVCLRVGSLDALFSTFSFLNSITSFGERSNTFETASDYFRSHFLQVHRRKDASSTRSLYVVSLLLLLFSQRLQKSDYQKKKNIKHFTSMLVCYLLFLKKLEPAID